MGTSHQRTGVFLGAALAALFTLPGAAFAVDGGTIAFQGSISAPEFLISSGVSTSRVATTYSAMEHEATTTSVIFDAPPGVTAGGVVGLQVNDDTSSSSGAAALSKVSANFVDYHSHALGSANGQYRVPQTGGVLSLAAKPGGAPSGERVTVVVSYE